MIWLLWKNIKHGVNSLPARSGRCQWRSLRLCGFVWHLQAICAEGKVRGGASVVAQAPNAKRALERFVHEMHSLFLRAGEPPEAITVSRDIVWLHASTKT
jgi:hypothetical protein